MFLIGNTNYTLDDIWKKYCLSPLFRMVRRKSYIINNFCILSAYNDEDVLCCVIGDHGAPSLCRGGLPTNYGRVHHDVAFMWCLPLLLRNNL